MNDTDPTLNPRDIDLEITSSRKTLELGEPWEILLHVHNHSPFTVWIADISTTLTLPAEVIHPGESNVASRGAQFPTVSGPGFDNVSIPPGGKYMCTWRLNEDARELDKRVTKWDLARWHMFFHPSQYEIQANIHIWTKRPDMQKLSAPQAMQRKLRIRGDADLQRLLASAIAARGASGAPASEEVPPSRRPETSVSSVASSAPSPDILEQMYPLKQQQADEMAGSLPLTVSGEIDVSIKSTSQFIAAALGGTLAFLFREFYALAIASMAVAWSDFWFLPTYVLVAVLISLFVSRITEARFPLTVRIMDFWGATAIGVIAAFAGDAILKKLLGAVLAKTTGQQ